MQNLDLNGKIGRQSFNTKDAQTPKDVRTVFIIYMIISIIEIFESSKTRYPDIKIDRSKFYLLWSSWVLENCPHFVSICVQHQSIDVLLTVSKYLNISKSYTKASRP